MDTLALALLVYGIATVISLLVALIIVGMSRLMRTGTPARGQGGGA